MELVKPIIVVVKIEGTGDKGMTNPGNRRKRDSQVISMNFLSRVMFDDRMSPLDYELFSKIRLVIEKKPDFMRLFFLWIQTLSSRQGPFNTWSMQCDTTRIAWLCVESHKSQIKRRLG